MDSINTLYRKSLIRRFKAYQIQFGIWGFIFFLYLISPYRYPWVSLNSIFVVIVYFLIGWIGYIFGRQFCLIGINKFRPIIITENMLKIYYIIALFSVIHIILSIIELRSNMITYSTDLSISGFTALRKLSYDQEAAANSSVCSIIANILSGFPLLSLLLLVYVQTAKREFAPRNLLKICKKKKITLLLISLSGILITLTSGGRNSSFFYFISGIILCFVVLKFNRQSVSKKTVFTTIFFGFALFVIFSYISVLRAEFHSGSLEEYIQYKKNSLDYSYTHYAEVLLERDSTRKVYFPLLEFHRYLIRPLIEMETTLSSTPESYPYLGGYQFYKVNLLLKKFGFDVITIDDILNEIENPGRYFTLIGSMYLDFGKIGMFLPIFLIFYFLGLIERHIVYRLSFKKACLFVLFVLIVVMAPVYSIIGMGLFFSFMVNFMMLTVISKFKLSALGNSQ